uniref:kelch repeat-containing protein n=1 Tax=Hyalangium versicolor TaxID=2861190 RepID=UPI00281666B4|nr:kelch repeat-containing protein [Hyalangium versicolor]
MSAELARTGNLWGGVISNIPAGSNRTFLATAVDSSNTPLFEGSTAGVTLSANQTTLVAITLQELTAPPSFSNQAPIIQSVVASPTTVQAGGTVSLQATVVDPNTGDTISYAWTASVGSFSAATSATTSWTAPATPGIFTLSLTVNDSQGATGSVSLSINVVSGTATGNASLDVRFNSWPLVSALSASATRLEVGQSTSVSVTASDSDNDSLSYLWTATCAGTWTSPTSPTASFSPSELPSGACNNCQLTATVSDGRGGQNTGSVALCVASPTTTRFPPTVTRAYQSSLTAQASQQLTFEVGASDPQNSSLAFSWTASVGGTFATAQNSANSSRIVWTAPSCAPANHPASLTATITNAYGISITHTFGVAGLPACSLGAWSSAGSMATPRYFHRATLLPGGRVLITGGYALGSAVQSTAELYEPATGTWSSAGPMAAPRDLHSSTLLPSGKVLIAGGMSSIGVIAAAQVYEPATGTWSSTGSMTTPRHAHTATLLPSGKVLITGGSFSSNSAIATAELYDPATGTWSSTGSMASPRALHTATLLNNGQVLITGGEISSSEVLSTAELYDPATGTWSSASSMSSPRDYLAATLLPSGKVLISGGVNNGGGIATMEVYDPATGTWSPACSMASPRYAHTATLLPSGKVLISGGVPNGSGALATADLYDPATGTCYPAGSMAAAHALHTATLLDNGKVLITGGLNGRADATAELYSP